MLFIGCICSCSENGKVRDGFFRGIYESSRQIQEMKHPDEPPQPGRETPTYDQYNQERQEILTDHESNQPQQQETAQ
jgi:hypothetical protein